MVAYDEAEAKKTDRAYQAFDVVRQRLRSLEALHLKAGEGDAWLADLKRKESEGSYFFCINRFIFTAVKP